MSIWFLMNFTDMICMSAIKEHPTKSNSSSSKKSMFVIGGVIAIVSILLFAYLMWYTAPDEYSERVKVIAITEAGCIAETYDGFAVNIGDCNVQQGEYVNAMIDAMNPTS